MLASPVTAASTLKNIAWWLRALTDATARETLGTLFDRGYYLDRYMDVQQSGVDPFLHFLIRGALEARSPSERFDTAHYLARYLDVKRSGMNPALHYALFGQREGRSARPRRVRVIEILAADGSSTRKDERYLRIDNAWPRGEPLVTVVIPCFNYGAFVEDALDSVLNQTFRNFEVIIVEGGSDDGVTPQVVARIEARGYPNVRVLYRSGRHLVGDNRNHGISHARGRYICCLDADDLLKPLYLEIAVFLAEGYGYDVVYSSLQSFGGSELRWIMEDATFPAIIEGNQIATTALFRKSTWARVGGYRDWGLGAQHIPEDWDFWVRLLGNGYRAKSIRESLMQYRVHGTGLTATCETDRTLQSEAIRSANAELFDSPAIEASDLTIDIANRWVNLSPDDPDRRPAILLALPFITIGGAEQLFDTVCQGFAARGFRIIVITSTALPHTMKEAPDRYSSITPHVYHLTRLLDGPADREQFTHYLIRRYRVTSLLLAGSELVYGCLPGIRAQFPELTIADQQFNDTGHLHRNRRYSNLIDTTIVPSRALADLLVNRYGESAERIAVIPHGVDVRGPVWEADEAFRISGLPEQARGKLLVSFFGRMSEEKSPETFVAMAQRLAHRDDLFFSMTGEGPRWAAVRKMVARRGLHKRLHLAGFVDDPRPLMELSSIVVLTSSVDGMPLVILEAQALGKPVVASAVGSVPEMVIEGETGFLCRPGDVSAFCRAVETLAHSEKLRRDFGDRGRRFVQQRYGCEAMVESYVRTLTRSASECRAAV